MKPLTSIIIPTKNSSQFLDKCLKSIKSQSYKKIEILVVDNNSIDNTQTIAKKYTKLVFNKWHERSAQRNYGAKKSHGKYFLFVDSDMILTPKVVEECVENVKDGAKAVIIPEISVGEGFWAKCKGLEKRCYIGDEVIEAPRFFTKKIFWKVGGWDENLIAGEDWDLANRIRKITKIGRTQSLIEHNEGQISLIQTVRKKYYYGKNLKKYIFKNRAESKKQFNLIRPAFVRNWRLLIKNPVYTIGLFIMKTSEFVAGGVGILFG